VTAIAVVKVTPLASFGIGVTAVEVASEEAESITTTEAEIRAILSLPATWVI